MEVYMYQCYMQFSSLGTSISGSAFQGYISVPEKALGGVSPRIYMYSFLNSYMQQCSPQYTLSA